MPVGEQRAVLGVTVVRELAITVDGQSLMSRVDVSRQADEGQ